jgi:protein-S-isoprenylcysteine O-methyltransferase Ste14
MIAKASIATGVTTLVLAALLFAAAGKVEWPAGWAFIMLFGALSQVAMVRLARRDPALLAERLKPPVQRDQPVWDKILLLSLMVVWVGWLVLIGLDIRFHWSEMPVWLQAAGAVGVIAGYGIIIRVLDENTFLAPVVKIQRRRGHHVIATGPYALVRHPMYSGMSLMSASTALLLGSWIGLAASALIIAGSGLRAVMEERELRAGLQGYEAYAARVRYRLFPLVW